MEQEIVYQKKASADKLLFRPHSLGDIMSGVAKGWAVDNSLTCKRRLIRTFREIKTERYYSKLNKYTEKGVKMEQDGITLYSLFKNKFYKKNEERITNEWFSGEPDIREKGIRTIDIKCAWTLKTLPHSLTDKPDSDYIYQGIAYMNLDSVEEHILVHCLVNAPANLIDREKKNIWFQLNCPQEGTSEWDKYIHLCIEIEKEHICDMKQFIKDNPAYELNCQNWHYDIPIEMRIVEFTIQFDKILMQKVYDRIIECRQWMNNNLFNN